MSAASTANKTDHSAAGSLSAASLGWAVAAWLVPGAAHLGLGRIDKAIVFFVVLTGLFAAGCALDGRLFALSDADWLTRGAALAQWGIGLPRIVAGIAGFGTGSVTAVTYEYGNTYLIASGLLNVLVMWNAVDEARSRKAS